MIGCRFAGDQPCRWNRGGDKVQSKYNGWFYIECVSDRMKTSMRLYALREHAFSEKEEDILESRELVGEVDLTVGPKSSFDDSLIEKIGRAVANEELVGKSADELSSVLIMWMYQKSPVVRKWFGRTYRNLAEAMEV